MTLYSKIVFFIIIFLTYFLTNFFSKKNEVKAVQKLLIISLSSIMFLGIIFPEKIIIGLANLTGVGRGPDALLYLFIIITISLFFALIKKITDLEYRVNSIIKNLAIKDFDERNNNF